MGCASPRSYILLKYILANTTISWRTGVIAFETRVQIDEDLFKNVDRQAARNYLLLTRYTIHDARHFQLVVKQRSKCQPSHADMPKPRYVGMNPSQLFARALQPFNSPTTGNLSYTS